MRQMRRKNKRNKFKQKIYFDGINLFFPSIFLTLYLIFAAITLLSKGSLYSYFWIIIPRGALTVGLFAFFYLVAYSLLGAITGVAISEKPCYRKNIKILNVLCLSGAGVTLLLWYNVVFGAFSLFFGFLLSIILNLNLGISFFMSFKFSKLLFYLQIPLILWSIYILWFSFCVMIIN